jgi:hypothetical protein
VVQTRSSLEATGTKDLSAAEGRLQAVEELAR